MACGGRGVSFVLSGWRGGWVVIKVTVDYSRFKAKLARIRERSHTQREAFVIGIAGSFTQNLVNLSPRDTHRYVRGWMMAARDVGVKVSALPALRPSKNREKIIEALVRQRNGAVAEENRWLRLKEQWYEKTNRPRKGYYNKIVNESGKARKRVERAEQELEKFLANTDALAIMRGSGAALNGYQRMIDPKKINLTVRDKVYGGRGRLLKGQVVTTVALQNLEPHSRTVEKYRGVTRKARALLRVAGLPPLKSKVIRAIAGGVR